MKAKEYLSQIEKINMMIRQTEINVIMTLAQILDDETVLKLIVEQLDLDWDEIKDKLPKPEEDITDVQTKLDSVPTEGEEG